MKRISILLAYLVSLNLFAAELLPSKGVSILFINQQEAKSKLGSNVIQKGFNQIVIRMDEELGRGSRADVFTSKPFILNLDVIGESITVAHPEARSVLEAEIVFRGDNPEWIVKQDGIETEYKQELLKGKSGLFPYSGMASLIEKHNTQRGIYFNNGQLIDKPVEAKMLPVAAATAVAVKPNPKAHTVKEDAVAGNVEQLKAWYLKSSTEERKAFRRWMIDQE